MQKSRTKTSRFTRDFPTTLRDDPWIKKGKTMWNIIEELKGTAPRKSFFDWLIKG